VAQLADMDDLLIVGAGPAGLTAAIYAARFRLSVRVLDGGASRAALIPCTRNLAGFPDGISGVALLERMRRHAERFEARRQAGYATALRRDADGFTATGDFGTVRARAVLLTTGVTNRRPDIDPATHDEAVRQGRLRYCPVCDAFEVIDRRVAVIGTGEHGLREAAFLRAYTADLTLIAPSGPHALDDAARGRARRLGIALLDGPARGLTLESDGLAVNVGGSRPVFDSVYPALGSDVHSQLATTIGAAATDEGCLTVDAHQRTRVPGLYAAGDVIAGLDQISHAMGAAAVAATAIRNDLAEASEAQRLG
jgi:thioredoxin reductase (NADPH)